MTRGPPISTLFPCTILFLFFFNDPATTEIYTLSLHDALPISRLALRETLLDLRTSRVRRQSAWPGNFKRTAWLKADGGVGNLHERHHRQGFRRRRRQIGRAHV